MITLVLIGIAWLLWLIYREMPARKYTEQMMEDAVKALERIAAALEKEQ